MSEFSDYRVVTIVNRGGQGSSYCVEEKKTGKFFIWEPVDYGLLTANGKETLLEEIRKLTNVRHVHLIQCVKYLDQHTTGTIYLVKEYCGGSVAALIRKCQSTKTYVDEAFIWKIVYQTARAVQAMQSRGPSCLLLDITATGVHLDDNGNVKLDYWLTFREDDFDKRSRGSSKEGSERRQKKGDSHALGRLVHSLATLHNQPSNSPLPQHYSQQLQDIVGLMVLPDHDKRPTIEAILYHPSLMSQVVTTSIQQMSLKESNETVNTAVIEAKCVRCKELESKVSEMRTRQANIKARENELKERERAVAQKDKHASIMEQLAREKLDKAEMYLSRARQNATGSVKNEPPDDLNSSSYSADPGDTCYAPTMARLDPNRIKRPPSLAQSVCSRRSIRFETIAEFDEPESSNAQRKWLENKRSKFKASRKAKKVNKSMKSSDKENQAPQLEQVNTSTISLPHCTKETRCGLLETFFR